MFAIPTKQALTSSVRVAINTTSKRILTTAAAPIATRIRQPTHSYSSRFSSTVTPTAPFSTLAALHRTMASPAAVAASQPLPVLDPITESNAIFFLCDIQETFRGKIIGYEPLIATAAFMAKVSNILSIPCITTEQKPFKPTVHELSSLISSDHPHHSVFSKSSFSMLTPEVTSLLSSVPNASRRHAVLFGIETHVCVLQTALDLLRHGFHVHVVVDAVSSQNEVDRSIALERFKSEAARSTLPASVEQERGVMHLTTAESVIFEILKDAQHPRFKELVPALKTLAATKKGGVAPSVAISGKL